MNTGLVLLLVVAAIAAWQFAANPRLEKARLRLLFGPTPRDYALSVGAILLLLGGPALALVGIRYYPLLDERSLWIAAATCAITFALSFWAIKRSVFPPGVPAGARVAARAGFSLCFVAWLLGIVCVANGYATPLQMRSVAVVRKEMSRERDPGRRQYRLYVLAWPESDRVTQVDSSAAVYDRVRPGENVQLTLGVGRLGLEWVRDVSVADAPSRHTH
jgi:hypothetical protein